MLVSQRGLLRHESPAKVCRWTAIVADFILPEIRVLDLWHADIKAAFDTGTTYVRNWSQIRQKLGTSILIGLFEQSNPVNH